MGRELLLEQPSPTSSWNRREVLISSALLMMPFKSANVSSACISRMGCVNADYRWRSSWFWYYKFYTAATYSSIQEMWYSKWIQVGNQNTELVLLRAPRKGQLQITQQLIAVILWHPIAQHFPEIKGQAVFLFRVLRSISKKSFVMKWYTELGELKCS